MKILTFRLQGKMAHFRRYYSNSSALTYTIPPRTTVIGMVAGLLGYPRDSYYDVFSLDHCRIAMTIGSQLKKQMQKMNLLMIKSPNDLNGSQEYHSQTPTELVIPQDIRRGFIDYRIWFSHNDSGIMEELEHLLNIDGQGYCSKGISLALGTAMHLGWIVYEGVMVGREINPVSPIPLLTVIPLHKLERVEIGESPGPYRLIREEVPLEFDRDRLATERGKADMLINLTGSPVTASVSSAVLLDDGTYITWME
jgi:CRISPR-associated protein Cas5h